jgi:hypothetical protein
MDDRVIQELNDLLRRLDPQEKRWLLRAYLRARAFCPMCPVQASRVHLDPCYRCVVLPDGMGQPKSTVN